MLLPQQDAPEVLKEKRQKQTRTLVYGKGVAETAQDL
jgi:hypothetical protein